MMMMMMMIDHDHNENDKNKNDDDDLDDHVDVNTIMITRRTAPCTYHANSKETHAMKSKTVEGACHYWKFVVPAFCTQTRHFTNIRSLKGHPQC
jgi:hypothetical protein